MKSVMEHSFSAVPRANINRSSFDRSHGLKTTFDADYLVPILLDDIIPGDTFNVNCNFFARLATPIHPIMDNIYLDTFFFFVPYRLLYVDWPKIMGAQDDPGDSIALTVPQMGGITNTEGSLSDYLGLPKGTIDTNLVSALPFRAYNLIWNEWFRDQNLQDSLVVDTSSANSDPANYVLKKRGKRHDYFTSALPAPQRGTAVSMPLGTSADIHVNSADNAAFRIYSDVEAGERTMDLASGTLLSIGDAGSGQLMYADLSGATAATINDIRLAFQTQKLLERDARSGTRYNETILAHYGVTVPDFRVQRPEFLGGGSQPINITPVPQTTYQGTPTVEDAKGNLAGFGTVSGKSGFTKSFTEHGLILGLANARADITYSQGLDRYWSKTTRYDFYYPVLAQIGEQSVLNSEIYFSNVDATDDAVFAYQERYAEYRYKPSRLTGLMKVDATGSLSTWHLSEDFSSLPTLGDTFIQSNTGTPLDAAIAVSTEPHFIADFYFNMRCARPMPLFGVPGNIDRF